jgi:Ca2+-binding EF-hand superfamily protein
LCDGEDITTAIDEWCVKAERVLNQHESDDENSALRIESSFDVCYEQLIRLRTLQDSLDDHDFVLASIGLEMTIEVWANTTTLGNSATFCLTRFKETVARISRDLDYFERKCQELLERLVIFYRREWELKDKGCISVVKRLAYGMVVEFKGRIEMLNRGASRHTTHGLTSPWTKLTSGANQMACEILQQSLEEDVQRITDIMHKKMEEKWAAGVALLREKLEKQNIHEALSAYETARTCGFYTIEAIDAQDPSTRDERLLELWTLKTKLDKGCQTLITCAATSVAFGPALTFQDAIVSIPTVFIIQSKNSKGELLEKGGEAEFWEIKITDGHGLVDFELLDNSNGTYEVTFVPRYEEGCQVSVAFRTGTKSQPLKGSPLNLKFRRDSFWIRRPVSDMPQNLGGRILLAGTTDMMIFFDPEQKEVYRLVQDREKESRAAIWRCTKGRLDGEDIRGRRMKGLFSISNNMFIAFTKALSQLYEGFDHSCFLLEMKENNTLFSKLLTTFEEDLPPDLIQIFTEKKHWAWSNVTCKTKDKMQGIPEFLPPHQVAPEILQLLEELLAQAGAPQERSTEVDSLSNTIAPNQPKLSMSSSSTETIMQLDHVEVNSCKAKMALVKGSCRTYEDFSLPIVIASVQHVEGQTVPVAITMTNFDQYSRTWHKRDSAIYCHGKLVVFGGCSEHTKLLTCYHPADAKKRATLEFQTVNAVGNIPCTRCNFYLGYTGKSILLHGGIDVNDQVLNDVYTYDLEHHRWFRLLSISIPSTLSSVYAAGMDSILTLYPGTPNMRMNIVDMQKILPRNSLHMCATFATDLITKVRSEMRSIQQSMNLQDSWLLRLAVFRTLNRTDLVANLENISEMIAFLKVHAEELSLDVTEIAEDFHSTRNLHQDLVKVATEWQARLKKKEKSAKKETLYSHAPHGHFESCCRLRIKCLNSQDMTVNAEFAFSSAKYSAAIKAIEQPTKALQNLKNDCIEFEELTTFFGVDPRMEEEKEIINKQLNTLSSFRRAWELHEQLYTWSDLLLGLPNLQGESILNEMKADLLDMASCPKFAASDLFRTLSQNILDADAALRFVDLLKLDSATCRNSWYAIRILCGLSQNILYPPTLGTILQKKIMQEPAVLEFMSSATKHFDESLYAGKVALLIDSMRIGGHDRLSHSMHSLTCFCEVKKVLKKPLPIRSTARFKFQPGAARMLALDLFDEPDLIPDLREVIAHARLGKIRKFKSMTEKEPQLYKKAVDVHGNNLLHIAASYGRIRIVEEIIRNKDKLDIFARNKYDKTAIDLAVEFKNHEIAAYLHQELPDLDELSSVVAVSEFVFQFVDSDNDGWINQAEYNAAFDLLDKDQDGFINRKEFGTASLIAFVILDKDGDNRLSRKEYEAGFSIFDFDGDGLISRAEFDGKAVPSFTFENLDIDGDGKISREDYQRGFDLLDANRDGFISELEFSTICSAPFSLFDSDRDGKLSRTEYEAGFDFFDIDKDGFLNKSEFLLVQSSNIFMEKAKVQGIRIDFTLHGTYPGCLSMPGGSAYLSFGAHADFVTYPPVKICSNSSGQAAGTPVEVSAWFIVGNESGPWNFAYGNTFTEISLDVNLDGGVPQTPSTVAQTCSDRPTTSAKSKTLHAMPFLINLASEKANTQVASTDLSRRNDGSSGHYSRAEFVAEFAALNRRLTDIKAVAARNAEEAQAEEQHLKRSRLIVRDAMNRPVLVDGIVRGISLCSIVAPWRRDALGRIIVPDGIQRNTHIEINTEADWRERVLIGVDASDETELDEMDVYTGDFDIGDFVDSLLTSALGCYDSLPDDSDDAIAEVLGEVEPSELQGLLQEALKFGSAVLVPNRTPSNYTDLVNHSNSSNT